MILNSAYGAIPLMASFNNPNSQEGFFFFFFLPQTWSDSYPNGKEEKKIARADSTPRKEEKGTNNTIVLLRSGRFAMLVRVRLWTSSCRKK